MKVFAVLLIAVGVLMAGLSGLCTAAFGLSALSAMLGSRDSGGLVLLVICLVIGSPFIAGGVGLLLGGLTLWKKRRQDQSGSGPV